MPRGGCDELFFARELKLDRATGLEGGESENILDEHLLLATKTAADPFAKHPHLARREIKNIRQRASRQERRLRAGTDVEDAGGIDPGEAAMGFQRGVLNTLGGERPLIGDGGLGKRRSYIAILSVGFRHDIALRVGDPLFPCLVAVDHWLA